MIKASIKQILLIAVLLAPLWSSAKPHASKAVDSGCRSPSSAQRFSLGGSCGGSYGASDTSKSPKIFIKAEKNTRKITEIDELLIVQWNLLNLFESSFPRDLGMKEYKSGEDYRKTPEQIKALASTLMNAGKAKPDIIVLNEIENIEALARFSKDYLNDEYRAVLIEGNDVRGIDVGFLVKRDLPFDFEVRSYKELIDTQTGQKVLSRDLPTLLIRENGAVPSSKPDLILMGTHYKSMRDSDGDPLSVKWRTNQVDATKYVIETLQEEFGTNLALIVSGDMNASVPNAKEFKSLRDLNYQDVVAVVGEPESLAFSHFYFGKGGQDFQRIDGNFASPWLIQNKLVSSAAVVAQVDGNGNTLPIPQNYKQREKLPSDHLPTKYKINYKKLREHRSSGL